MNIKKGDNVKITAGKDKGKTGKVVLALPKINKIVVEGVAVRKRNMKPRKQGQKGQVAQIPTPFNASNAMIVCPSCSKPARLGSKKTGDKKIRFCKKCEAEI